jgi:hypothetical protein
MDPFPPSFDSIYDFSAKQISQFYDHENPEKGSCCVLEPIRLADVDMNGSLKK